MKLIEQFGKLAFPNATYNDDLFHGWLGIGSQIDGLGHIGDPNAIFYNCHDGKEFSETTGLTKLGIEKIPPIVTRGIIIDIAKHFKKDYLKVGETFDVDDVIGALSAQKLSSARGSTSLRSASPRARTTMQRSAKSALRSWSARA